MYIIFLITWKTLKKYHFILKWTIQVLHERMGLKGKELVLWKWIFIVKQKNNSEEGALSKTKLHVMSSLFHFTKNLFAFIITFLKSKITAFHSSFIQGAFWNCVFIWFSVETKLTGFSYRLVILWSILFLFLKIHKLRVIYFFMSFVFLQCPMIHLCRQLC